MVYEHAPDNQGPREQLTALLQRDFTLRDDLENIGDNPLALLLQSARDVEGVDARFGSSESQQLGEEVAYLLDTASVTDAFTGFIAHEVRTAHARQMGIREVISPDRLGLLNSQGIFDPMKAEDIEAQTLRGYLFDYITQNMVFLADAEMYDLPPIALKPTVRPSDYHEALARIETWVIDFRLAYDKDPFAGLDPEAFYGGLLGLNIVPEAEAVTWAKLNEWLTQLDDDDNTQY